MSVCFLFLGKYWEKCVLAKAKLHTLPFLCRIHLDRSDLTDVHVLEILRGKDHRIINLEHENQKLTNDIAKLNERLSDSQSHQEHLTEKLNMLYSLVEVSNNLEKYSCCCCFFSLSS